MLKRQLLTDPYGPEVWLLYGTASELTRFFAKRGMPPINPRAAANFRCYTPDDSTAQRVRYVNIVKSPRTSDRVSRLAVLAHELIHCVFDVFDERQVGYESTHDEAFTYYHEYLFRQCAKVIW